MVNLPSHGGAAIFHLPRPRRLALEHQLAFTFRLPLLLQDFQQAWGEGLAGLGRLSVSMDSPPVMSFIGCVLKELSRPAVSVPLVPLVLGALGRSLSSLGLAQPFSGFYVAHLLVRSSISILLCQEFRFPLSLP